MLEYHSLIPYPFLEIPSQKMNVHQWDRWNLMGSNKQQELMTIVEEYMNELELMKLADQSDPSSLSHKILPSFLTHWTYLTTRICEELF
jgi:hypothetical protein